MLTFNTQRMNLNKSKKMIIFLIMKNSLMLILVWEMMKRKKGKLNKKKCTTVKMIVKIKEKFYHPMRVRNKN